MRMKRVVTKVPGSFLSGPARRGKRRQSEEDAEDQGDGEPLVPPSQERGSQQPQEQDAADNPASFVAASYRDFAATGSPVSAKDSGRAAIRKQIANANIGEANDWDFENVEVKVPVYKSFAPPVNLPSAHDKENEAPSSFKRSKPQSAVFVEPDMVKQARPLNMDIRPSQPPPHASPERKALAMKSHNTPHRPAPPPPPKMSVVETATKPAGAAATAPVGKKRAILLRVNDRTYTRIDCLGRGGSGKVYRVTAENGSMYALKRVSIENADETMVKGLKGEIDLLKRLTGVDRVIQLYDWELNEEKKMISLVSPRPPRQLTSTPC
jgi:serine/threonine-protein kinase TTK/MPS1